MMPPALHKRFIQLVCRKGIYANGKQVPQQICMG